MMMMMMGHCDHHSLQVATAASRVVAQLLRQYLPAQTLQVQQNPTMHCRMILYDYYMIQVIEVATVDGCTGAGGGLGLAAAAAWEKTRRAPYASARARVCSP